jgi:hypothetical protein
MSVIVIHGPMRTGKTFHAKRFCEHYRCDIVGDLDEMSGADLGFKINGGRAPYQSVKMPAVARLLLLTTWNPTAISRRLPDARIISIEEARKAIGVGPVSSIPRAGQVR